MPKPNLKKVSVRLPEGVTVERALAALTEEKSGEISLDAKEVYEEMVQNLEFPKQVENQTQAVFEGQLLVLGDSRVGKTSLVKALTGQRFDHGEKKTHGVETEIVDRKWRIQELTKLVFGRFDQFPAGMREEVALLPRIFNTLRYRYGGSHRAHKSDEGLEPWTTSLFGKSGMAVRTENPLFHLLGYLLTRLVMTIFLTAVFGSLFAHSICSIIEFGWLMFHAVRSGAGTKDGLFAFCGASVGLLFGRYYLASNLRVPAALYFYMDTPPLTLERVIRIAITSAIYMIFLIFSSVLSLVLSTIFWFVCAKLLGITRQSPIFLLIDNVMDITYSLVVMVAMALAMCAWTSLFLDPVIEAVIGVHIAGICSGVLTVALHLLYLYHQNLLCNRIVVATLVLELCSGLCTFFFDSYLLGSVCVFSIMFSLHGYGKWLQIRKFFQDKSLIDVLIRGKYAIYIIVVRKIQINKEELKAALDEAFAGLKLRILDFAGDKEYYVYHHMFMRKEALYIIAFSIRDFVQDNFQHTDKKLERLWFWLQSVCSHVNPRTPIFLVGTHRGRIKDETLDVLNGHLRQHLWSVFSDQLVTCKFKGRHFIYFPVENSEGSNDFHGIRKLRSAITRIAHEKRCKASLCREVLHSWIKVQDAIIKIRTSSSQKLCWAVEELKEHMKDICNTDDLQNVLEYFHAKGLVIYISAHPVLSKWVLLNPELLVKIIVKLVNILPEDRQKRGSRQHWSLLRNTGRLSKSLLHNILSKAAGGEEEPVRKLLEEYDLICLLSVAATNTSWSDTIPATHFVPSLLPTANKPTWYDHPDDVQCYVRFKKFLPEPLFHRLLSRCCKHSQAVNGIDEPHLYCDCGLFWLGPGKPYHLKLLKEECMIEVTFNR